MNQTILERAETFIYKNARLIDRHLFAYHFKNGSSEAVISTLLAYQNADGGFGHALEPDIRCPNSQPVPVEHALKILDTVGFDAPIAQSACDYLLTITTSQGGVPWLMPSAHAYPRAPWWNAQENQPASLNPTAGLAALLHKNNFQHNWLAPATEFCWKEIATLEPNEMHTMGVALSFLYHASDRDRAERELARLIDPFLQSDLVADINDTGYVRKPLDWAGTPDHPLRKYFKTEDIEANLDVLIADQQEDGGWNITWPATSPACELEWRGWLTLENLLTLKANGRLSSH
jgi:hypothetical protein